MHTTSSNKRRSRLARTTIALVAFVALVAAGGCEYLGLDQSGGGGGSTSKANKQQKQKSGNNKKKKANKGEESGGDSSGEQAKAGGDSQGDSANEEKGGGETPPSLEESGPESEDEEDKNRRVNPFAASPDLQTGADDTEEGTGPKRSGPLQRYSYEKYRLAGLISETAVPKAMFIAPDGVGHVLKKGDRIGKEGGAIQDIRENEVELELPPEGEEGRPREVSVELRQAEVTQEEEKEGLSEEEKKTLERLLQSEQGREAVRQEYKNRAAGGRGEQRRQGGEFQGLEPPSER